jgi:ABC-type Fe3+/spermidine/putrescine transport system ATPase subunit
MMLIMAGLVLIFLRAINYAKIRKRVPVFVFSQLRFPQRLPSTLALGSLILISSAALVVLAEILCRRGVASNIPRLVMSSAPAPTSPPQGPIISLSHVSKNFGTFTALTDININIVRGEFFSLLGASGCGMTTLLQILAGIEQPSKGTLLIDGQPMVGIPANRRPTNMVFQSYAIFPHLSVRKNVGYGLAYLKISKAKAQSRTDAAIAMVKLDGLGERGARELSGGQRQPVALARAFQRSVGITFVFVTHPQEEALTLSVSIAVKSQGKVLQIDSPDGLYKRPNCREVAEFIGTMNVLARKVSGREGSLVTID